MFPGSSVSLVLRGGRKTGHGSNAPAPPRPCDTPPMIASWVVCGVQKQKRASESWSRQRKGVKDLCGMRSLAESAAPIWFLEGNVSLSLQSLYLLLLKTDRYFASTERQGLMTVSVTG